MKNTLIVCVVGLLVFVFSGITFALDEEDAIVKRHEKWMGRLMADRERGMAAPSRALIFDDPTFTGYKPGKGQPAENEVIKAARQDLCARLGIDEKRIKDFGYVIVSSMTTCSIPPMTVTYYRIGLAYKNETYIYEGHEVYCSGSTSARVNFTGEIIPAEYDVKGNLILNASDIKGDKKSIHEKPRENFAAIYDYDFVVKDLAEFLGVSAKKIDIIGEKSVTNQEWADKYNNGWWAELAFGTYRYSELSLAYKGEAYTYGVVSYNYGSGGHSSATLDPGVTGGVLRRVGGPYLGAGDSVALKFDAKKAKVDGDLDQRKSVEARIELKGSGENYTFSPQMADAPGEAFFLPKK